MDYSQQELSALANRLADKIQFRRPSIGTHTDYVLGKRGKVPACKSSRLSTPLSMSSQSKDQLSSIIAVTSRKAAVTPP